MAQKHNEYTEQPMTRAGTVQGPSRRYRRLRHPNFPAAEWASKNPLLQRGELGIEKDTHKMKAGDGVTYWNDLPYMYDDAGQPLSTADYQMGNASGGWDTMSQAQQDALNSGATTTNIGQIATNTSDISDINTTIGGYGDIVTHDVSEFATAAQGSLADTAVQPGDLATVATSGSYNDLTDKPTIGNATLTIQKNGTNVDTFTANATTNKSINITVPVTAADVNALPDSTKYVANASMTINSSTYVVTLQLKDQDGNNIGTAQTVDLPLETMVVSGSYDDATKKIILTLQNGQTIEFSVADLVSGLQTEITANNMLDADLVDDSTSTNKFVTSSDITTWNGKQDALTAGANINISGATISATDTTYTGSDGITLTGTNFTNSGVRSVATGTANGTIAVNTNGTTADVSVKGLGSAAYTASTAYATAAQGALADTALQSGDNVSELVNDAGYLTTHQTLADLGITATASEINVLDGITASTTELNYVDGVTSSIQTQLNGKQATISDLSTIRSGAALGATAVQPGDLATVATTGDYGDLLNKPTLGTMAAESASDYTPTASLAAVATSGQYSDLTGTPTIPTVNDATITITQGGVTKGSFTLNQASGDTIALDAGGSSLPSQTGHSGEFLTTDGTDASWSDKPLVNTATATDSLTILGTANTTRKNSINIGIGSQCNQVNCVVVGKSAASGSDGVAIGYSSNSGGVYGVSIGSSANAQGTRSIAIGNRAKASGAGSIQLNTQNASVNNTDANTFKVANANGNFEIMSADGTIPAARHADTTSAAQGQALTLDSNLKPQWATVPTYSDMTGATAGTAGTHGLVPAPAAGDQDKVLHGDGTWKVGVGYHPELFTPQWSDHIIDDMNWLRADTFSWQSGTTYSEAYDHLADDISGKSLSSETINGITVQFYLADDGHKICPASQESNVASIYAATGAAWYYVLDTVNTQFKLPRINPDRVVLGNYAEIKMNAMVDDGNGNGNFPLIKGQVATGNGQTGNNSVISVIGYTSSTLQGALSTGYISNNGGVANLARWIDPHGSLYADLSETTGVFSGKKYLYFYVGNFTQTALENTAGLNASLFNGKVDLDGSNATFAHIIDFQEPTANNSYTWYIKYSNGFVIQGGRTTHANGAGASDLITLPIEFANTGYCVLPASGRTDGVADASKGVGFSIVGTTSFYATMYTPSGWGSQSTTFSWVAFGMAA